MIALSPNTLSTTVMQISLYGCVLSKFCCNHLPSRVIGFVMTSKGSGVFSGLTLNAERMRWVLINCAHFSLQFRLRLCFQQSPSMLGRVVTDIFDDALEIFSQSIVLSDVVINICKHVSGVMYPRNLSPFID